MTQSTGPHVFVVVLVTEERPVEIKRFRVHRHDLASRQSVGLLLYDKIGPDRLHDDGRRIRKLFDDVEQPRIVQLQLLVERCHLLGGVAGGAIAAAPRNESAMPSSTIHLGPRRVVDAEQPKGNKEYVQQARVIRVLDVLEHQLPVCGNALARNAENTQKSCR